VNITLNGKPHEAEGPLSVAALVQSLKAQAQVAVAVNGEVVRRADWASVEVREADVIEVVRAVGGGA
jgi:sulfur carrier protein